MDLAELEQRLLPFCQARYEGSVHGTITEVITMPGHAGFAYGFKVWPVARRGRLVYPPTAAKCELGGYRRRVASGSSA